MRFLKVAIPAAVVVGGGILWYSFSGGLPSTGNKPWPATVPANFTDSPAPLSPEDALKTFTLAPGYSLELAASEPLVEDPILAEFDGDGRLWVLEMHGFAINRNMDNSFDPVNDLVVLEDTDRDGAFDKRTVFMEGLIMPRAMKVLIDNCALVGAPPSLWKACDTDGDLVSDTKELISENFSTQGVVEHGANGLYWSMDNTLVISEGEWNLNLKGGKPTIMPSLNRGQWGVTQDDFGRVFRNVNTDPLFVDYLKPEYYARNPNLTRTSGLYENLVVQEDTMIWPARPTVGINRGYRTEIFREDGSSTYYGGVSSPMIYRGTALPEEIQGQPVVVDGPTNIVHLLRMKDDGTGNLSAEDFYDKGELVASTDERFRPVSLTPSWDGSFYIIDMYRGVSQDGPLQTDYLRDYIQDKGLWEHINMGRIYHVVHDGMDTDEWPQMSKSTPEELVGYLSHRNGWWRDTAQQYLVQRGDRSVVPSLVELASSAPDARTRLHAIWTLDGLNAMEPALATKLLKDSDPFVRASAVRLLEGRLAAGDDAVIQQVVALAKDPQATVRRQVAASLGELPDARKVETLLPILIANAQDPVAVDAVVSGIAGQEDAMLTRVLASNNRQQLGDAVMVLSGTVARGGNTAKIRNLVNTAGQSGVSNEIRLAVLTGLSSGLHEGNRRGNAVAGGRAGAAIPGVNSSRNEGGTTVALGSRPQSIIALSGGEGPMAEAATEALALLTWPGKPATPPAPPMTAEERARFNAGHEIYTNVCAGCHQPAGRGAGTLAADLDGSKFVNDRPDVMARILLNGKEGNIGLMPPAGAAMSDDEVAAVMTFVRASWSNRSAPVLPAQVKEWRQAYAHRETPWTEDELGPKR